MGMEDIDKDIIDMLTQSQDWDIKNNVSNDVSNDGTNKTFDNFFENDSNDMDAMYLDNMKNMLNKYKLKNKHMEVKKNNLYHIHDCINNEFK